uniref:Uncharacterized protein n=1 Tax=Rhizophora mucronata TaxID=61149 RepID=A0A2P2Q541_RHIMU
MVKIYFFRLVGSVFFMHICDSCCPYSRISCYFACFFFGFLVCYFYQFLHGYAVIYWY